MKASLNSTRRLASLAAGMGLLAAVAGQFMFGLAAIAAEPKPAGGAAPGNRPNVLFIAVDDLRPELGCYGCDHMHTPHLDRLGARGVVFERAYCNYPVCGASRSSVMTGLRPTPSRFRKWNCSTEKDAPGIVPLNAHFKRHGYYTVTNGKIFNNAGDSQYGWSEPDWRPGPMRYHLPENQRIHAERQLKGRYVRGPATESADSPIEAYRDGEVLTKSLADLRRLAGQKEPFFLAVGFYKPHLPFVAPRKYWELYDRSRIELPETYLRPPKDAPSVAIHSFGELRAYSDIPPHGPVSDEMAITLIHGYYACVSFIDDLLGTLLDELDRLELSDNTIVVLWGDHGWNLGEHTLWCKHCCFETSMRAPLIVAGPGVVRGGVTRGLTEFVDIYPTLCDMASIPAPGHLVGKSFVPLLEDPQRPWKLAAIGRYEAGETIRTDRYRYTEYLGKAGEVHAHMLYDHESDPQENVNISLREQTAEVRREHAERLHALLNAERDAEELAEIPGRR